MDNDPRPLHLDIIAAAGVLLGSLAGLLAALGHPLSPELHEALLGLVGAIAIVSSIVVGRIRAARIRQKKDRDEELSA